MAAVYRIYERGAEGAKLVAEVRDGLVTGTLAAAVRTILELYGFPYAPLQGVIDQFVLNPLTGPSIVVITLQDPEP